MRPFIRTSRRCFSTSTRRFRPEPAVAQSSSTPADATSKFPRYPFSNKVQTGLQPAEYIPNDNRFLNRKRLKNDFSTPSLRDLRKGVGLMPYLQRTLPRPESHELLSSYFAKKGKGRITPGSVITVTLSQAPFTFSGVLISIRRKGPDSNILLRNVVRKIGVEMRVYLASPTLLGIKVVQRAGGTKMNEPSLRRRVGKTGKVVMLKTKKTATSTKLLSPETAKGWKRGQPGPVPTMRVARAAGIIPDKRRAVAEGGIQVDEKDASMGKHMHRAKLYFLRDYPSRMSAISAGITKKD